VQFTGHFDHFLRNTVNLPKGKIERLDEKTDAVYRALKTDVEMPLTVVAKIPQGSGPQKTIINPPLKKEFDADFLLEVEEEPAWDSDPRAYRDAVAAALKRHPVYGKMPRETKSRCVRVIYAGDFHLDVVPFVRRAGGQYIVNGDDNTWEATDPTGFTDWFNGRNSAAGGHLRAVLRIMKYVRDTSDWGGTRSVLLTILAGERVSFLRPLTHPGCYVNVPSTLVRVMEDLDTYLQAHETKPPMPDPAGSGTSFDHRWDQATYDRLRTRVHAYAPVLVQAYLEQDPEESLRLWQSVLGEKFTAPPPRSPAAEPFGPAAAGPGRSGRAG
jgi:hypothetical protein